MPIRPKAAICDGLDTQASEPREALSGRWRDPEGRQRSRQFKRKLDATRFAATVEADKLTGRYIDPDAGKITFGAFANAWLAAQTFDALTREAVASRLRAHLLPRFKRTELRAICPSPVQAWLGGLDVAPLYAKVPLANLSAILGAAVEDGLIVGNPCAARSVKAPRAEERKVVPWPLPRSRRSWPRTHRLIGRCRCWRRAAGFVRARRSGCAPRMWTSSVAGCSCANRSSSSVASPSSRHLKVVGRGRSRFPRSSRSHSPSDYARTRCEVTLPWRDHEGGPISTALVFSTRMGGPLTRRYYNTHVWKPVLKTAGVEPTRANGMHALRHH